MKKLASHLSHWKTVNPMVVFWMGVLIGALVVAFAFLYKGFASKDLGASVLYRTTTNSSAYSTYTAPSTDFYLPPPPTLY